MRQVNVIETADEFVTLLRSGQLQGKLILQVPKIPVEAKVLSDEFRVADGVTIEQLILAMCQQIGLEVARV